MQVGSTAIAGVIGIDAVPNSTAASFSTSSASASATPNNFSSGAAGYQSQIRSSIPTLHTRSSYQPSYTDDPAVDAYTYTSSNGAYYDKQPYSGSFSSPDGLRSWGSAGSQSAAVNSSYYEPMAGASTFGSLQTTYPPTPSSRYADTTTDGYSALNMSSLHSSLPTPFERRLPVPCAPQYHGSLPNVELPDIRALTVSNGMRYQGNGVPGRTSVPWPNETSTLGSHHSSINGLPSASTMLQPLAPHSNTSSSASEPTALGYQLLNNGVLQQRAESPTLSPTFGSGLQHNYQHLTAAQTASLTSTMHPPSFRYAQPSTSTNVLPAITANERSSSSTQDQPAANLYSFSSDTVERPTSLTTRSSDGTLTSVHSYPNLQQPQPQHVASAEALRRQSSFDQQSRLSSLQNSASGSNGRY